MSEKELTWDDIKDAPEWKWARDRAAKKAGWGNWCHVLNDAEIETLDAIKQLALMIAKHEQPPQETPRSLVVAREEAARCGLLKKHSDESAIVQAAQAAYERCQADVVAMLRSRCMNGAADLVERGIVDGEDV